MAFPPARPDVTLASVLAERGVRQLHVAETEKYAHVTYFFNGGEEEPYDGRGARAGRLAARRADLRREARDERARPRPTRSSRAGASDEPGFGIINFANPDMVGHTGVIPAAVKAIETVDALPRPGRRGGARESAAPAWSPPTTATPTTCSSRTAAPTRPHSMNPVPLIVTADVRRAARRRRPGRRGADGARADGRGPAAADDGQAVTEEYARPAKQL